MTSLQRCHPERSEGSRKREDVLQPEILREYAQDDTLWRSVGMVIGVNHVQVNVPSDDLERARAFYVGFMGLKEIARPSSFKSKGIWMHAGNFEMHIGVEDGVNRSATRAHVAYEVNDLAGWRTKISNAGYDMHGQPLIPGYDRFQFRDPFGNNVELIAKTKKE